MKHLDLEMDQSRRKNIGLPIELQSNLPTSASVKIALLLLLDVVAEDELDDISKTIDDEIE